MKTKSLFISTIAMVVLLVVALATGTFAWYSAQQTATATGAALSTAAVTNASIALTWDVADLQGSPTISFGAAVVSPAIPTAALADYDTDPEEPVGAAPAFTGASIEQIGSDFFFTTAGSSPNVWTQKDTTTPTPVSTLYILNANVQNPVYVTPVVTLPAKTDYAGDPLLPVNNNDILRVAIFSKPLGTTAYNFLGVWGYTTLANNAPSPIYYGTIAEDANINTIASTMTALDSAANGEQFTITNNGRNQLYVYAWLEGTKLNNQRSSLSDEAEEEVTFTITFNASPTAG